MKDITFNKNIMLRKNLYFHMVSQIAINGAVISKFSRIIEIRTWIELTYQDKKGSIQRMVIIFLGYSNITEPEDNNSVGIGWNFVILIKTNTPTGFALFENNMNINNYCNQLSSRRLSKYCYQMKPLGWGIY